MANRTTSGSNLSPVIKKLNLQGKDQPCSIAFRRNFSHASQETPQRLAALDVPPSAMTHACGHVHLAESDSSV
jgi:hypothetical protein